MSEDQQERAARYLRTLVNHAKRDAVYSLGVDLDGVHADIVCVLMDDGQGGVLVPVAKLIDAKDVAALIEKFGAVLESDCAGRC